MTDEQLDARHDGNGPKTRDPAQPHPTDPDLTLSPIGHLALAIQINQDQAVTDLAAVHMRIVELEARITRLSDTHIGAMQRLSRGIDALALRVPG